GDGGDGDFQLVQLSGAGFGSGLLLGSGLFQLGATSFERSDVLGGGRGGLALRQQVVAAVASANLDLVAQVAEVGNFFQQDDFHLSLTSYLFSFTVRRSGASPATAKIKPTVDDGVHHQQRIDQLHEQQQGDVQAHQPEASETPRGDQPVHQGNPGEHQRHTAQRRQHGQAQARTQQHAGHQQRRQPQRQAQGA